MELNLLPQQTHVAQRQADPRQTQKSVTNITHTLDAHTPLVDIGTHVRIAEKKAIAAVSATRHKESENSLQPKYL